MSEFLTGRDSGFQTMSTLTPGQSNTLDLYSTLSNRYIPKTSSVLARLAMSPQSAYSAIPNWYDSFKSGVQAPMEVQLRQNLAGLSHSPERHSSFRRTQEGNMREDTSGKIAEMQYNQMMQERQMKMSALENAFARQQNALSMMNNFYSTGLNRQALQGQWVDGSSGLLGSLISSGAGTGMGMMGMGGSSMLFKGLLGGMQ